MRIIYTCLLVFSWMFSLQAQSNRSFIVSGHISGGAYAFNGKHAEGMYGIGVDVQSQWFKNMRPNSGPGFQVTWLEVAGAKYGTEPAERFIFLSPLRVGPAYQWRFANESSLNFSLNVGYTLLADCWSFLPEDVDGYHAVGFSPQLQWKTKRMIVGLSYLLTVGSADRNNDQILTQIARLHIGVYR